MKSCSISQQTGKSEKRFRNAAITLLWRRGIVAV
jgi:hypothetical protein